MVDGPEIGTSWWDWTWALCVPLRGLAYVSYVFASNEINLRRTFFRNINITYTPLLMKYSSISLWYSVNPCIYLKITYTSALYFIVRNDQWNMTHRSKGEAHKQIENNVQIVCRLNWFKWFFYQIRAKAKQHNSLRGLCYYKGKHVLL